MARVFVPKIATANDLLEGDVVYFTADGTWSRLHEQARVAHAPEDAEALLKQAEAFPQQVVGVYLADVAMDEDGAPQPVHFRETFRTRGPSNYFHGKQAV